MHSSKLDIANEVFYIQIESCFVSLKKRLVFRFAFFFFFNVVRKTFSLTTDLFGVLNLNRRSPARPRKAERRGGWWRRWGRCGLIIGATTATCWRRCWPGTAWRSCRYRMLARYRPRPAPARPRPRAATAAGSSTRDTRGQLALRFTAAAPCSHRTAALLAWKTAWLYCSYVDRLFMQSSYFLTSSATGGCYSYCILSCVARFNFPFEILIFFFQILCQQQQESNMIRKKAF